MSTGLGRADCSSISSGRVQAWPLSNQPALPALARCLTDWGLSGQCRPVGTFMPKALGARRAGPGKGHTVALLSRVGGLGLPKGAVWLLWKPKGAGQGLWLVSFSAESAASRCLCKIGQGTGSSPEPRDPGDKQTQTRAVCMPVHVGADVGGHVVLGSSLRSQACRCSGWREGGEIP